MWVRLCICRAKSVGVSEPIFYVESVKRFEIFVLSPDGQRVYCDQEHAAEEIHTHACDEVDPFCEGGEQRGDVWERVGCTCVYVCGVRIGRGRLRVCWVYMCVFVTCFNACMFMTIFLSTERIKGTKTRKTYLRRYSIQGC